MQFQINITQLIIINIDDRNNLLCISFLVLVSGADDWSDVMGNVFELIKKENF